METVIGHVHNGIDSPKISTNNIVVNSFLTTPTASPTENYQVANKYYCDLVKEFVASNTLKTYYDTETLYFNDSWTKKKEIIVRAAGTVRVKFDLKPTTFETTASGKIYINGVVVGVERVNGTLNTWVSYSEDFDVSYGDTVEFWAVTALGASSYFRNFRMYYDMQTVNLSEVL